MDVIDKPLKDFLAEADEASSRASELSRNLALGAIAVVWIFKNPESAHSSALLPDKFLVRALFLAVGSLGIDLSQYIFKSISIYIFYHSKEKAFNKGVLTENDISDLTSPLYIRIVSWILWSLKIISIGIAYGFITAFLYKKL